MISIILAVLCGLIVIVIDQLTKFYVAANHVIIPNFISGLINITSTTNDGAAWGMFSGKTIPLICFTAIVMAICVVFMVKMGGKNKILFWALSLIISGGIGNMIDRIIRGGAVVDFLQFDFWKSFPVFNIADCAIVIGGGLMILYAILDIINDFKTKSKKNTNREENEDN